MATNTSASRLTSDELLQILSLSKNATAIYTTRDIIIQTANDVMLSYWGKSRNIIGLPIAEAIPELEGQPFVELLQQVWDTGETYEAKDTPADLQINGKLQTCYFDFEYRAIKNSDGSTYCILHTTSDVTEKYFAQQQLIKKRESEKSLYDALAGANQKLSTNNISLSTLNEELAALNEELNASNEELAATNEELATTNDELIEAQLSLQKMYVKQAESERLFRNVFEQAQVGLAVLRGPDLVIEQVNENMLKIWGREYEHMIDRPIAIARPELQGQDVIPFLKGVYSTGIRRTNTDFKVYLHNCNGGAAREVYVNSIYQPLCDDEGNVDGILIVLQDVTEDVQNRMRIDYAREMLDMAVATAELGTWYINAETREFVPSARLKDFFGFNADEQMPYNAAVDQIVEEYRNSVTEAVEAALTKGEAYSVEYPILGYHDQTLRWVRATGKLYPAEDGKAAHFSGTMLDITERKLDENRKNDFIAMVSHELKTPLTSVKAYIQMLNAKAKKADDSFASTALNKADQQVNKMNTLIKGFLDVARIEAGKIQLNLQDFDLSALLEETMTDTRMLSQTHEIVIEECHGVTVTADRDKIGQVINNFLTNAMKYSPAGKTITLSCIGSEDKVLVSVKDEGMGIKEEDIEKLFDRFYRVQSNQTKTISGFGIGLYLCAEIIQRHKGTINVESEVGKGSTFSFSIPMV